MISEFYTDPNQHQTTDSRGGADLAVMGTPPTIQNKT